MKCGKIISYLNAYADGELPEKQRLSVKEHLADCEACQKRFEDIRRLDGLLNGALLVPPVPDGFASRVMMEARRKRRPEATLQRPLQPIVWNPLRWIAELSAPMRIAACVTMLLAFVIGLSMDGGRLTRGGRNSEPGKNLYGFEWFEPAPPGSIGSIYIAMTTQAYEERK